MRKYFIIWWAMWVLGIIGYIMNLVKFCQCDFSSATSWKAEIIHGVGVFTGLGAITGWFDLGI
jgi:hypothetical protein